MVETSVPTQFKRDTFFKSSESRLLQSSLTAKVYRSELPASTDVVASFAFARHEICSPQTSLFCSTDPG